MAWGWEDPGSDIPSVVIEPPYRSLVGPLLAYLDEIDQQNSHDTVTVILPGFSARHWWEQFRHNQAALLFRPGTVVTCAPYHLERGAGGRGATQ